MTISCVGASVSAALGGAQASRAVTPALPTGWTAEDYLLLPAYFKDYRGTVAASAGWTTRTPGYNDPAASGTAGTDSGAAAQALFDREAVAGITAPTVTLTTFDSGNAANVVMAHVVAYRKAAGTTWDLAACGTFAREQTTWYRGGTNPGITAGDWIVFSLANASDSGFYTPNQVVIPGCTVSAIRTRADDSTSQGGDGRLATFDVEVLAGTATGPPEFNVTASVVRDPVLTAVRIREVAAGGGLTPVEITRSTSWRTLATAAVTRSTTWRVRATVALARSTSWDVLAGVTPLSRPTSWRVLSRVSTTRSTSWNVETVAALERVEITRSTSWRTLTRVTASRPTTWDVLANVGISRSTTWDILARVTSTRSTTWRTLARTAVSRVASWDVLSRVAAATRSTTWRTLARTSTTRSTTWHVEGLLDRVEVTRPTSWRTLARVTPTRSTSWDVLSRVATSRAASWDVRALVAVQRSTSWRVLALVEVGRGTTWRTLALVEVARSTTWNVESDLVIPDRIVAALAVPGARGQLVTQTARGTLALTQERGDLS